MKKQYTVVVVTVTRQRYNITAHSSQEVKDLWNYDPEMFQVVGSPTTQEFIEEVEQ
jgi:hypothetical protein